MLLGDTGKRENGGADESVDEASIPAAITDTGCERELNEDRYAVVESPSGLAWIVCDGMGGVAGGELAAQLAIDAIRRDLENLPRRPADQALRGAMLEANRVIVLRRQNPAFSNMGTTIVASLFNGAEVIVCNVGDSRAYLIRDNAIQQLTTDHTLVQEMVDKGQIRPDEALSHPQAHILTRCIGSEPGLDVEFRRFWVWEVPQGEPTDALLLCTDGLYSLISEGEMANVVSSSTPQRACVELVELAKARGGFDNITLSIIPLAGQLKQEPPVGFDPDKPHGLTEKRDRGGDGSVAPHPLGMAILAAILTGIGVLLTVLITAFFLGS